MDILDYLARNQVFSFAEKPFNDIDNLLLAHVSYLTWDNVVDEEKIKFSKACESYFRLYKDDVVQLMEIQTKERRMMLSMMMNSNRYKDMMISSYVNEIDDKLQKQFSAITIEVIPQLYYISIKGTDEYIVSWKEDFNMAYLDPIPAQTSALEYVKKQLEKDGKFMLGGHSKGGNLAVYAGVKCKSDKIVRIYNNDGPGFSKDFINSKEYKMMESKMISIVPEASVVGMLFNNTMYHKIVASNVDGVLQHDGLTWEIEGDDFKQCNKLSDGSELIREVIMNWFDSMDNEEKVGIIDNVYMIIDSLGIKTVQDLYNNKFEFVKGFISSIRHSDKGTKKIMFSSLVDLLKSSGYSLVDTYVIKKISKKST